jgi:hypothetical protein
MVSPVREYHGAVRRTGLTAVAAALLCAAPAAAYGSSYSGPPKIAPWTAIGGVRLGMARAAVEALFGRVSPYRATADYPVTGGRLSVAYAKDRVVFVATTSSYYRTPDGIRVGYSIPLGRCAGTPARKTCPYPWRGFTYAPRPANWHRTLVSGGRKLFVNLFVDGTKISQIQLGQFVH